MNSIRNAFYQITIAMLRIVLYSPPFSHVFLLHVFPHMNYLHLPLEILLPLTFFAIYYLQPCNMRTASAPIDCTLMFSPTQGRQKLYIRHLYKLTSNALPSLTTPLLTQRSVSH